MPPHGGVVVAEEGNRRKGEMSRGEIRQCIMDILSWFERKNRQGDDEEPTPDSEITAFIRDNRMELPLALEELYNKVRGNSGLIWFEDKKFLSLQKAAKIMSDIKEKTLFPFCADDDECLLVVDCSDDTVYEYDLADGLGSKISSSFSNYLEVFRDQLLADTFDFIDEIGLVEKVQKSPAKPSSSYGHK